MKPYKTALVVGAGSFGTSIGNVLSDNFERVVFKVRSEDVYSAMKKGENSIYLPGLALAKNLVPALSWEEVDELIGNDLQLIVSGLPTAITSDYFRQYRERFEKYFSAGVPLVSLSKGIAPDTLELSDDIFYDLWPKHRELFTFLSGPSFAGEIMRKQITLVTLAGKSRHCIELVSKMFETNYFKALGSYDVKGVLLGGALKNVIAIAGGIIEGLGYNDNTRAVMITRGIAEMLKFGRVYNARPETFYGLSGMGDLILTTTGGLSRNKRFGLELAKGRAPEEIIASQRLVVEGHKTTLAANQVAERYAVRTHLFRGVYKVLYGGESARDVIASLMRIPARFEVE